MPKLHIATLPKLADELANVQWTIMDFEHRAQCELEEGEATGNPTFFWEALSSWRVAEIMRSAYEWVSQTVDEVPPLPPQPTSPAVSDVFQSYLLRVAMRITSLADGVDFREVETRAKTGEEHPTSKETGLSREAAMQLVPAALDLARKGYNAFTARAAANARANEVILAKYMSMQNWDGKKILDYLMEHMGTDEERSVRRRLAQGRRSALVKRWTPPTG